MWKDFFYFSGLQRAGIILLFCLIIIVYLLNMYIPVLFDPDTKLSDSLFTAKVECFKNKLVSLDSLKSVKQVNQLVASLDTNNAKHKVSKPPGSLFIFDPNKLDSLGFIALGIKPFVVSNLLKYRNKGGVLTTKEALSRIYGLSVEKYKELVPYICITKDVADSIENKNSQDSLISSKHKNSEKNTLQVELNTADTAMLMSVKGIGRWYAIGIVRYRKKLGGFVNVEQLNEIDGMTPENYKRIKNACIVNPEYVYKIKVNIASVAKLKAHPYLNFYQARQIYEYRRRKGKINTFDELTLLTELDTITLKKIAPYVSFE